MLNRSAVSQSSAQTIALSFDDHKQTALFFGKLWPLHSMDTIPEAIHDVHIKVPLLSEDGHLLSETMGNMIMAMSKSAPNSVTFSLREMHIFQMLMEQFYRKRAKAFDSLFSRSDGLLWFRAIVGSLIYELLTMDGYHVVPVFADQKDYRKFFSTSEWVFLEQQALRKTTNDSLQINVNNLRMIATDRSEWQQIEEFRADTDSISKLRNLRLLFDDKYTGKDPHYISDDIDKRIETFEEAAIKHGFELRNHVVTSFLDPKSLLGVASLAGISSFIGGPPAATVAAVAGAVLHTTKVFFEVKKKRFDYASDAKNNEIAYILKAKDRLTTPRKWYQFWR